LYVSRTSVEGGKVSRITIGGDRIDPINLMHTVGRIGGVIEALKPSIKEDDVQRLIGEPGFMRGDSDESIGTPETAIEDFAAIKQHPGLSREHAIRVYFPPRF
jgi:hypothetical protein